MEQQPVDDLQGRLLDVLVGPVHGVARLEPDDGAPVPLGEGGAGLGRVLPVGPQHLLQLLALDDGDRAAHEQVVLPVDGGDARVVLVIRPEDVPRLGLLVVRVDLVDLDDSHEPSRGVVQGGLAAGAEAGAEGGGGLRRRGQGDRQAPEGAVGEAHLAHGALVVGAVHEAGEGAHGADGDEVEVGGLAKREGESRQAARTSADLPRLRG